MDWMDRLFRGNPNSPEKKAEELNKKALRAISNKRLDDAESLLQEAIRIAPNLSAAHHNLGALYLNQNRHALAIKHVRLAVNLEPNDVESRIALAKILEDTGKSEESLAEYEKVCRDAPEDWRSHISLGNALLQRDRVDEAIQHLEKAVILKSKEELTHLVLAAAYERKGEWRKAIKQYQAAKGTTKVAQNRTAASQRIKELQRRQAEERGTQG